MNTNVVGERFSAGDSKNFLSSEVEGNVRLQIATDKKGSFLHELCFPKLRNENETIFLVRIHS